ncbi:YraN family protein [Thermomicrobium sp. CFH 73360]|uniref:YraN family protein n=1 Tax=Thermomicrobium sp. CFH 73360 TaxID=2951987 RepID=UPI00207680B4|nr:YraN family protein [Thermomicrobium sp. CFH 73360]
MKGSELGEAGEAAVARWLADKGWVLIVRNWRSRSGELDIVALDDDVLVAVEVKVRRVDVAEPAEWAVTIAKRRRLLATLAEFLAAHPEHGQRLCRIDLVAVTVDRAGRVVRWRHFPGSVTEGEDGWW